MAAKQRLVYREGFVATTQAACGIGRHRSVSCQTLDLKPAKGGFNRKRAVARGPYRFFTNQRVGWYETTDGMVVDIIPR